MKVTEVKWDSGGGGWVPGGGRYGNLLGTERHPCQFCLKIWRGGWGLSEVILLVSNFKHFSIKANVDMLWPGMKNSHDIER